MRNWNVFIVTATMLSARSRSSTQPVEGDPLLPAADAAGVLADHAAHEERINEKNF
jgi:hypothetical protein